MNKMLVNKILFTYKKLAIILLTILLLLLNPTFNDFKEFIGSGNEFPVSDNQKVNTQLNKPFNFLFFSIYTKKTFVESKVAGIESKRHYLAILKNFIKISESSMIVDYMPLSVDSIAIIDSSNLRKRGTN